MRERSQSDWRSEAELENAFADWCEANGHLCLKLRPPTGRGFPDRLVFTASGKVVALEWKLPGKGLSLHQRQWLRAFRARNIPAYRVDSLEEAQAIVEIL